VRAGNFFLRLRLPSNVLVLRIRFRLHLRCDFGRLRVTVPLRFVVCTFARTRVLESLPFYRLRDRRSSQISRFAFGLS